MTPSRPKFVKQFDGKKFTLYRAQKDRALWQARLKNSNLRRRFYAESLEQAILQAPEVLGLVVYEEPDQRPLIEIGEAFTKKLATTQRSENSQKHWLKCAEMFMRWLMKAHPAVAHWHQLSRQLIREYQQHLVKADLAQNTIQHYLRPIKMTAHMMHLDYDFKDIGAGIETGGRPQRETPRVHLADVLSFCDYLAQIRPDLELGALLQGLAGLRVTEAMRLTWEKVDLERGLIEISGEVKNRASNRVIPVCRRVLGALRVANKRMLEKKVIDVCQHVVATLDGAPWSEYSAYCRRVRYRLREWNPNIAWAVKDLRNCLFQFAEANGIRSRIWEEYLGHSDRTVTGRSYLHRLKTISPGEERELAEKMELFRRFVITPLENGMQDPSTSSEKMQLFATLPELNG